MNTLPIDELNNLKSYLNIAIKDISADEIEDEVLDILIIGWANGLEYAGAVLGESNLDYSDLQTALNHKIDGETYVDRLREHIEAKDIDGILLVAETESHRLYNTAVYESAVRSGQEVFKTWETMEDDRVRWEHYELQGVTVPINDVFTTDDGHSTMFPGGFGVPELDCNCRCFISISTKGASLNNS